MVSPAINLPLWDEPWDEPKTLERLMGSISRSNLRIDPPIFCGGDVSFMWAKSQQKYGFHDGE